MGEKKRELVFMGQSWWFVVRGVVRRESAVFSLHTRFTALLLSIIIALMNIFRWRLPVTCFWDNSKFGEEDTLAICSATDLYTVIIGDTYANISKTSSLVLWRTKLIVPNSLLLAALLPRIRSMQDIGGRMEDPSYPDPGMSPAYLKYYPHVIILQQIQLLAVLAPLFLWHCVEDGYMNMICRKFLNFSNGNEEKTQKHRKEAAEFLVSHLGHHSFYAWTYAFCELLNLFMVILQAWAMTWVAGGPAFRDVGWAAVSYYWNLSDEGLGEVANPVLRRFPTLAKCEFNKYGPAGSVVPHEGVCSLPLNYVIRIYFLVFW